MSEHNGTQRPLAAPVRNRYFYGKLLDVYHFEMEQTYLNRKRWLLNRLGLGAGVLCGLELELTEDGQVLIHPGVAVDPHGREIVVPSAYCIEDPRQPTDSAGRPDGDPVEDGEVTICLVYHECAAEPTPVLVADCDTRQECAPGAIRERFRVLVHEGTPHARPGQISDEQCATVFPQHPPDDFDRQLTATETLAGLCPVAEGECVVLGTLRLGEVVEIDYSYRAVTYSNTMLYDLLMCLAHRVDECCRTLLLRYVSGDAQSAAPGATLPQPLLVEVVDENELAVSDVEVRFSVRGGGGSVSPVRMATNGEGRAGTRFTLGGLAGLHTVEASIASGSSLVLMALAVAEQTEEPEPEPEPEPVDLPVINRVRPSNGAVLSVQANDEEAIRHVREWARQPRIEFNFSRAMNREQLEEPDTWLRVHVLVNVGEIIVRPIPVGLADLRRENDASMTAIYGLETDIIRGRPSRYLIQIRAENNNLVDDSAEGVLLDADYRGTALSPRRLEEIWNVNEQFVYGRDPADDPVWASFLMPQQPLPSGNGQPGGVFHSWFEVLV